MHNLLRKPWIRLLISFSIAIPLAIVFIPLGPIAFLAIFAVLTRKYGEKPLLGETPGTPYMDDGSNLMEQHQQMVAAANAANDAVAAAQSNFDAP